MNHNVRMHNSHTRSDNGHPNLGPFYSTHFDGVWSVAQRFRKFSKHCRHRRQIEFASRETERLLELLLL